MAGQVYVDESKVGGLIVCAGVLDPKDVKAARGQMRELVHRGSRRVHMTKERPERRMVIAHTVATLPVQVTIYNARSFAPKEELKARQQCLSRLVDDMVEGGATRLVIERDESIEVHDRRALRAAVHARGVQDLIHYEHMRAQDEPLLWVADAVAWCWVKGAAWKDAVDPVVTRVVDV